MKKIGICTVYTGYNYGSALQAYATKHILTNLGYKSELLTIKGSILPGRDIRINKLFTIIFRSLFHSGGMKNLKNYGASIAKKLPKQSIACFNDFFEKLQPKAVAYHTLKKEAHTKTYYAFLSGSDQVWNSAVFYVDPFYYLRFAPSEKRIAFAPSFGRNYVPDYNKKRISGFISEFKYISVRESSGADIIKELTGKDAEVLIDPTLVLSAEEWTKSLSLKKNPNEKYLLAYFLDTPSKQAIEITKKISRDLNLKIINLPYVFENSELGNTGVAGPCEFVEYIKNAKFVCTDSFHGTAFSLNFNIPFYTFDRNYGNAGKQSARIESILKMASLSERYEPNNTSGCMDISFEKVNSFLNDERIKSREYLINALHDGEK